MHDCIEGTGTPHGDGYYTVRREGKNRLQHRQVLADHRGVHYTDLKEHTRHLCHNRGCIDVNHLDDGTAKENKADSMRDGKYNLKIMRGEDNPMSKLTENDVEFIRGYCASGVRGCQADMYRKFGVSRDCIHRIVRNKRWRDDKDETDA